MYLSVVWNEMTDSVRVFLLGQCGQCYSSHVHVVEDPQTTYLENSTQNLVPSNTSTKFKEH